MRRERAGGLEARSRDAEGWKANPPWGTICSAPLRGVYQKNVARSGANKFHIIRGLRAGFIRSSAPRALNNCSENNSQGLNSQKQFY